MSAPLFNLGRRFERPYESAFALLRRCLSVNPGVSGETLLKCLTAWSPDHDTVLDRLRVLPGTRPLPPPLTAKVVRKTYQRQCPLCAQQLYHSDLYAFDWLTVCPLHRCAFTRICPECGEPWPDYLDIARRDCPRCGRLSFAQLIDKVLPAVRQVNYQRIVELYRLLDDVPDGSRILFRDPDDFEFIFENWSALVPITSEWFAALQARRQRSLSDQRLRASGCWTGRVSVRSAHLFPAPAHFQFSPLELLMPPLRRPLTPALWQARRNRWGYAQYQVVRHIVDWVARRIGRAHTLHIRDYSGASIGGWVGAQRPCPYCLAFSVWCFHSFARPGGLRKTRAVSHCRFLEEAGVTRLFTGYEPELIANDRRYYPDSGFSLWFYQRGLEICFLDLLRFAFALIERLSDPENDHSVRFFSTFYERDLGTWLCSVRTEDRVMDYYYAYEHPLEAYTPPRLPDLDSRCGAYQAHKNRLNLQQGEVLATLPGQPLTPADFYSLRRTFDRVLNPLPRGERSPKQRFFADGNRHWRERTNSFPTVLFRPSSGAESPPR